MKTYISGPLHAVRDLAAARSFYETLATTCRDAGWEPYLPHQNTDPEIHRDVSEAEVFDRDLHAIQDADVIVAYIGQPSSGVGAELGIAFAEGRPVVALYHENESPSRFLLGMLRRAATARLIRYRTLPECNERLRQELLGLTSACTAAAQRQQVGT